MAKLVWDDPSDRWYEAGIDRGVLFVDTLGYAWNGLISVDEGFDEDTSESYYIDGDKYLDFHFNGDFNGVIRAYTYPDEFLPCEGLLELEDGLSVDNQDRKPFGLSYRTFVKNADGTEHYKIHILYNLVATPSDVRNKSISDNVDPLEFTWKVVGQAEDVIMFKPTSHIILDSRTLHPDLLAILEQVLYGTEFGDSVLFPIEYLVVYSYYWPSAGISVLDNFDGTYTAVGDPTNITVSGDTFQLINALGSITGPNTYELLTSN